jgi:hypothetical protein
MFADMLHVVDWNRMQEKLGKSWMFGNVAPYPLVEDQL